MAQNTLPVDVVIRRNSRSQFPVIFEVNFGLDSEGLPITGQVLLTTDNPAAENDPRYRVYNDDGDLVDSGDASGYTPGQENIILVWKNFDFEAPDPDLEPGRYTVEIEWEMLVTGEAEKRTENRRARVYVDY